MKFPPRFLFPAFCFALALALSFAISRSLGPSPSADVPAEPRRTISKHRQNLAIHTGSRADRLRRQIGSRPSGEWAEIWSEFADQATIEDLQTLAGPPLLGPAGEWNNFSLRDAMLDASAREELALRSSAGLVTAPAEIAALAESDPAAAWQALGRLNRSDLALSALRTMARHNPAEALDRFLAMPTPVAKHWHDSNADSQSRVYLTPIGGFFGGWARHDPQAAVAALAKLPPGLRTEATVGLALTWAYHDGPAAIRFLLGYHSPGSNSRTLPGRLDVMLRASLRTHPRETAELLRGDKQLREHLLTLYNLSVVTPAWFRADPDGLLAWWVEGKPESSSLIDLMSHSLAAEPEAVARLMRGLARHGEAVGAHYLHIVDERAPELAQELADELGLSAPDPHYHLWGDPARGFDSWLAALRETGDPDAALAATGLSRSNAVSLTALAIRHVPERAAELKSWISASWIGTDHHHRSTLARLWPELAETAQAASPSPAPAPFVFPYGAFHYDPATAAATLLDADPGPADVTKAVEALAPQDPQAARAWLANLPSGPARDAGALVLAKLEARRDPIGVLRGLVDSPLGDSESRAVWENSLRRLAATGGDWELWLSRAPQVRGLSPNLADSLAFDARLFERLRGND